MKKLSITTLFVFLLPTAVFAQSANDYSGHVYEEAIEYLYEEGIVSGYPDGTFRPNLNINRAEFLKIVVESQFDDVDYVGHAQETCFKDVVSGNWYTQYVCFAKSRGIVEGYSDGTFKPEQNINLSESLKMIYESMNLAVDNPDAVFKFKYYSPAMKAGYIPDELVGGYFDIMTRGDIAEIMYRILIDPDKVYDEDLSLNLSPVSQMYDASCGTAALAIALSGQTKVSEQEIINKMIALGMYPNNEIYQQEDGKYIWDDPQQVFVGNYDGLVSLSISKLKGYGFLERPLVNLARQWAPNSTAFTGSNTGYMATQLEQGYPVIVFADVNARSGSVILTEPGPGSVSWYLPGGNELYTAKMYKHNIVLEGFKGTSENPEIFHVIDPFKGTRLDMTSSQLNQILSAYNHSGVVIKF